MATRREQLEALSQMLPGQFELVLARLEIPTQHLASREAAQSTRAAEVVKFLETAGRLSDLDQVLSAESKKAAPARKALVAVLFLSVTAFCIAGFVFISRNGQKPEEWQFEALLLNASSIEFNCQNGKPKDRCSSRNVHGPQTVINCTVPVETLKTCAYRLIQTQGDSERPGRWERQPFLWDACVKAAPCKLVWEKGD